MKKKKTLQELANLLGSRAEGLVNYGGKDADFQAFVLDTENAQVLARYILGESNLGSFSIHPINDHAQPIRIRRLRSGAMLFEVNP